MHTINAAETIGRVIEFFAALKQAQIQSILAGVVRGVISQRLLPRTNGGVVPAVVMVVNTRIADLIREDRPDEITDAIGEGSYFDMQTFDQALLDLVADGIVDRETAANVAANRHDFLLALDHELKRRAVHEKAAVKGAEQEPAAKAPFLRTR